MEPPSSVTQSLRLGGLTEGCMWTDRGSGSRSRVCLGNSRPGVDDYHSGRWRVAEGIAEGGAGQGMRSWVP